MKNIVHSSESFVIEGKGIGELEAFLFLFLKLGDPQGTFKFFIVVKCNKSLVASGNINYLLFVFSLENSLC